MSTPERGRAAAARTTGSGTPSGLDLPGMLRALRRRADLSQRELATRSGIPQTTVASIESGTVASPRFRTVEQLVAATEARLAIIDADGTEPALLPTDDQRDRAQRRYPPHLDLHRVSWEGARQVDRIGFVRDRAWRDRVRKRRAGGVVREDVAYEIRRLGPGDGAVLAALQADAGELDLAGRKATSQPLPEAAAVRYLRDPSLRHWVAQERHFLKPAVRGRVLGHLVGRVHQHHAGPPALVVTELGVRPEHRDAGIPSQLISELDEEAVLLGAGRVLAMPDHPAVARFLRRLGFRPGPAGRLLVLTLPR